MRFHQETNPRQYQGFIISLLIYFLKGVGQHPFFIQKKGKYKNMNDNFFDLSIALQKIYMLASDADDSTWQDHNDRICAIIKKVLGYDEKK